MTDLQSFELEKELGVRLFPSVGKRCIHVAGHSDELVCKALERLGVLLTIKVSNHKHTGLRNELTMPQKRLVENPLRAENVVYAEHHVYLIKHGTQTIPGFTADIRYMANIEPRLTPSTLLDRLTVDRLENAYRSMYQQACSLRVCPYDPSKNHPVSLLGPKVDARPRDRTKLGNRPTTATKTFDGLAVAADELSLPTQIQTQEAANPVETWIKKLPVHAETVTVTNKQLPESQAADRPPPRDTSEDLMNFGDEASASCYGAPVATPSETMTGTSETTPTSGNQILSLSRDFSALQTSSGTSSMETVSELCQNGLAFTGDDCLIDMLAAVETTSPKEALRSTVNWKMQPLVASLLDNGETTNSEALSTSYPPVMMESPTQEQNATPSPQTDQRRPQQGTAASDLKDAQGAKGVKVTKKQGSTQKAKGPKPLDSHGLPSSGSQPRQPSSLDKTGAPGQLLATKDFEDEIESAMVTHLSMDSYRRGRVAVRAEFGRIILKSVDESGLAFNSENTRSNGWTNPDLIGKLNKGYGDNKHIHFTNILSTYAYDIEDMINTKAQGARLWEEKPNRAWTTYCFHCVWGPEDHIFRFIVDIEDDGSSSGNDSFSYSIRYPDNAPSADKPMPVYVHAICRHWDLRIVTSHAKTDELEVKFGAFARRLMRSLSVSYVVEHYPCPLLVSH